MKGIIVQVLFTSFIEDSIYLEQNRLGTVSGSDIQLFFCRNLSSNDALT